MTLTAFRTLILFVVVWARTCHALSCQDIQIPVTINAVNKDIPSTWTAASFGLDLLRSVGILPNVHASGDYVIGATYCEPSTVVASRQNTLQVLLHGAGYNRTYWSSLGLGVQRYNWVEYAARLGFPTLAIDRLCNGASSRPSGLLCQIPSEAEVLHQLVQKARKGQLPITNRSQRPFTTVIPVGHSVGADICNYNAGQNPADANALVLTGWSNKLINGVITTSYGGITPASIVYPDRYRNLGPSYLTFASESGQRYLSYYGDYDTGLAHYDYLTQGTFTIGEAFTALLSQRQSPSFTGAVFLLDGDKDPTYCQPNPFSAFTMFAGDCSSGIAAGTQAIFPRARAYGYYVTPNTGHNVNLHRTAQTSFKAVFDFLTAQGF